jgi:hypothetical protein
LETKQLREIHVRSFLRRVLASSERPIGGSAHLMARASSSATPSTGMPSSALGVPALGEPAETACARRGGAHRTVMRFPAGHLFDVG